ncbi:Asp-tRNA(Asn)/Glu-tRNA(Gln) amidotransferase subunit GatC [Patulibacter sp. SYSU D01012]|uniref:Asp-tRNA(Asn)/Glu-tRNA(Gln) amidotransferase subunit GatC n=1 Tax=Patulibacter sp. SYSU D01012 TaxID=2817381 RepID=UPI001B310E17|nr:Asp-tRNA(Asn)/Glu-tRNA(Gln) amidotransferase subunit GatC [Patulibacter sp. SYSU D01012]
MIDRDTVLHVATLSRLELHDDEIEPMARELSAVLGHLETISELDLEGVEPTAHVVAGQGLLRADEPHRSLDRDVALAQAPDATDDGFRVPSPQA